MNLRKGDIENDLVAYIKNHPIINTHSHHFPDNAFVEFSLDALLKSTYLDWCGAEVGVTRASHYEYLEKVRFKSYFVWLLKSIKEIYSFDEVLSEENWDILSELIRTSHQDPSFHLEILEKKCKYEKIILDTYWNPGDNNGHPEVFSPTFRIDPLFLGFSTEMKDHDGNNPSTLYGVHPETLSEYLSWVRDLIIQKKSQGCVALKNAIAYDRSLSFERVSKEKAERVFNTNSRGITANDIQNFQNYLFNYVCEMAAEYSLPLQCHTGMGQLFETRAMEMKQVIESNPNTKFVLFHCSYPWTSDISGLLHVYPNVYPDLCWLPLLSPTAAKRTLHELIEIGTSDKICWGCDTWTSEESYGAVIAFRSILSQVLNEKMREGYLSGSDAEKIADNVLVHNARNLYGL